MRLRSALRAAAAPTALRAVRPRDQHGGRDHVVTFERPLASGELV